MIQTAAVHISNLSFGYGRAKPVCEINELLLHQGQRYFLHGPSGSGKTTLLGLIAGILQPRRGQCQVLGHDLVKMSAARRDRLRGAEMGYIFQGFNLIPYLSVRENIGLPCRINQGRLKRIASPTLDEEIERIAVHLEMGAVLHRSVRELSTGQQQRVAIARAVIGKPGLVIADEPTSSLDADRRDRFLELLFEVCDEAQATLLFVSHDQALQQHFETLISLPQINSVHTPDQDAL